MEQRWERGRLALAEDRMPSLPSVFPARQRNGGRCENSQGFSKGRRAANKSAGDHAPRAVAGRPVPGASVHMGGQGRDFFGVHFR